MIRVNANLFRIAYVATSTEASRYYLNGVLVEPHHEKGAILTATNGHILVSIHDETGHCDQPTIVQLTKEALKACPLKHVHRLLVIEDEKNPKASANIWETDATHWEIAGLDGGSRLQMVSHDCIVDGTFPDYRRVIPKKLRNVAPGAFSNFYLEDLGTVAAALGHHFLAERPRRGDTKQVNSIQLVATGRDDDDPAAEPTLVLFPRNSQAFAVLMPVKSNLNKFEDRVLPSWFKGFEVKEEVAPQAAAAE